MLPHLVPVSTSRSIDRETGGLIISRPEALDRFFTFSSLYGFRLASIPATRRAVKSMISELEVEMPER